MKTKSKSILSLLLLLAPTSFFAGCGESDPLFFEKVQYKNIFHLCTTPDATTDQLNEMILSGQSLDVVRKADGATPLHVASEWVIDPEVCDLLLKHGAKIDAQDAKGQTPLHYAARNCYQSPGHVLIAAGADVNSRCINGQTPLHEAVSCWTIEESFFHTLLKSGADIDATNISGSTPLHKSVQYDNFIAAELLLEAGARTDLSDNQGNTPLHVSVQYNRYLTTIDLIEAGVQLDATNNDGDTALHFAAQNNLVLAADELLRAGADCKLTNNAGQTALHISAKVDEIGLTLESLIANGVVVDAQDDCGRSALHYAAESGSPVAVYVLLESGASPSLKDSEGWSPLELGRKNIKLKDSIAMQDLELSAE